MPKTIDNDILLMDKTFGFDTAVEEAQRAINSAYIEVQNALNSPLSLTLFIAFAFLGYLVIYFSSYVSYVLDI